MARLRRVWGVQFRHQASGEWVTEAAAPAADREAAYRGVDALFPENEARVVTRVVSDWEVDHGQA